jgi:uncharacterized membrane protein (UPF0127 family)
VKHFRLVFIGLLIGFGLTAIIKLFSQVGPTGCRASYRNDTTISAGVNSINAELAKTDEQKSTGLGGRSCIGANQGMLFVFKESASYSFWMKDMKFPIDIIWINENKTVNKVIAGLAPSTYPKAYNNTQPAKYVLEIRSGSARQLNITEGTTLEFNL